MTDIVALDAQRPIPGHVPPELVYDYPLTVANKTTENPFDRTIPEVAARPIAFYARGAVLTGGKPGYSAVRKISVRFSTFGLVHHVSLRQDFACAGWGGRYGRRELRPIYTWKISKVSVGEIRVY